MSQKCGHQICRKQITKVAGVLGAKLKNGNAVLLGYNPDTDISSLCVGHVKEEELGCLYKALCRHLFEKHSIYLEEEQVDKLLLRTFTFTDLKASDGQQIQVFVMNLRGLKISDIRERIKQRLTQNLAITDYPIASEVEWFFLKDFKPASQLQKVGIIDALARDILENLK